MMVEEMYYSRDYFLRDAEGGRHRFRTRILATPETIDEIVKARNIGETVEPLDPVPARRPPVERTLADSIETGGFTAEALHMACFVGFLALKSGVASIEDVLGDFGLIHEVAHNMHMGEGETCIASRAEVARMARRLERAIPGHPYR